MSGGAGAAGPDDPAADDGATPWPFIGALAVGLVTLLGVGALTLANRDRDTETDRVVRAVLGQNDALQRLDYADFRANTCARDAGTEAQVLDRQRTSVAAKGGRYVGNVTDVSMSGDTASATVTYYFERNRDDKTDVRTALVREDGAWRVCTAGPS